MSTKKMKPEVKAKWLEALRSGEFTQGKGSLCDMEGNYCCLGVLSELAVREGVAEKWLKNDEFYAHTFGKKRGDSQEEFLPRSVQRWSGLDMSPEVPNPDFLGEEDEDSWGQDPTLSLAELNDNGSTFAEIADLIEQNF